MHTYEQHNISCYDNNKISKHFAQRDTPYFNIDLTIVIERNSIEREKEREREREIGVRGNDISTIDANIRRTMYSIGREILAKLHRGSLKSW